MIIPQCVHRMTKYVVNISLSHPSDCWENCKKILGDTFLPHPVGLYITLRFPSDRHSRVKMRVSVIVHPLKLTWVRRHKWSISALLHCTHGRGVDHRVGRGMCPNFLNWRGVSLLLLIVKNGFLSNAHSLVFYRPSFIYEMLLCIL